ncbi:hypothetical protein CMQ_2386 [Grosmannia clavigera kw1407]|uniref:Uncharacterized protein n=1 Tax=Grosmannia clavigera (strain kw1407 / UAMH 11150) TaxID=655863 RepID=F0XJB3_GROCL|nr:uncharacterized protein CMQ_2386 [Grosmannia clavigera kw1407]EFX02337.1 hypothetical protein CMQ_2386 [Grosmannia clavigera kw1407]
MTLRDIINGLAYRANAAASWALGPTRKAQIDGWFVDKYHNQPFVFGLAVTSLAFAAVPTAIFAGYIVFWALISFAIFWAILLFWAGLGLLLFVPALFLTTGLAVLLFLWAAVSFIVTTRALSLLGFQLPFLSSPPIPSYTHVSPPKADTKTSDSRPTTPPTYSTKPYDQSQTSPSTTNGGAL